MTYKAVGFDYGGVITGEPSSVISKSIATLLGVPEDDYVKAYYHHNLALNEGLITWQQLWAAVLEELHVPGRMGQLMTYLEHTDFGKPDKRILQLITTLRHAGLKVGLLSNNTREAAYGMRKSGLDAYFDVFDISAETGYAKPLPEAFIEFARQLEVEPNELIFIDDSKNSLSSAKEVGYMPILYVDYDELIGRLTSLGLPT